MIDSFASSYSARLVATGAPLLASARMRSFRPDGSVHVVSGSGAPSPPSRCSTAAARFAVQASPSARISGATTGPDAAGANTPHSSRRLSASPGREPAATAQ